MHPETRESELQHFAKLDKKFLVDLGFRPDNRLTKRKIREGMILRYGHAFRLVVAVDQATGQAAYVPYYPRSCYEAQNPRWEHIASKYCTTETLANWATLILRWTWPDES